MAQKCAIPVVKGLICQKCSFFLSNFFFQNLSWKLYKFLIIGLLVYDVLYIFITFFLCHFYIEIKTKFNSRWNLARWRRKNKYWPIKKYWFYHNNNFINKVNCGKIKNRSFQIFFALGQVIVTKSVSALQPK